MYYNTNNQNFINDLPSAIKLKNGTVVVGDLSYDKKALSDSGYFWVKKDFPPQPPNSVEDVDNRTITFYDSYVEVERVWIPSPINIPATISARQIRLWLIENNISLTSVENAINGIADEKLREKTLVEWEYAPYIERNHPLLNTLGQVLGLNNEQIDNAFLAASLL